MKKLLCIVLLLSLGTTAKGQIIPPFEINDDLSLSAGYGTGGLIFRGDFNIYDLSMADPFTGGSLRIYLDLGFKGVSFDEPTFIFNRERYVSDARMIVLGLGGGLDAKYGRWSLYPFFGFRTYDVRFTDPALVDAIGTYGIRRYKINSYGYEEQVGPLVENAYGNAFTIDAGGSVGYYITSIIEVGTLIGISPVKFSTSKSLFGEYFGEPPYPNDYYVKPKTVRAEVRLRFNF